MPRKKKEVEAKVSEPKTPKVTLERPDFLTHSWGVEVVGQGLASCSGAVPFSIQQLVEKPNSNLVALKLKILDKTVEMHLQAGDVASATKCVEIYEAEEKKMDATYRVSPNVFKRDKQAGGLYLGAHCFFGAFRDAIGKLNRMYYQVASDRGVYPSDKHLREYVRVLPNHVFFYRDGKRIMEPDRIDEQQPCGGVRGFATYEVIDPPFTFSYMLQVVVCGEKNTMVFGPVLSDKDKVMRGITASSFNGIGARRSANFGAWEVVSMKLKEFKYDGALFKSEPGDEEGDRATA